MSMLSKLGFLGRPEHGNRPCQVRTCAARQQRPSQDGTSGADANAAAEAKARRLSRLLEKYQGSDLDAQQAEAKAYAAQRPEAIEVARGVARTPRGSRFTTKVAEIDGKRGEMFTFDASSGKIQPNVGVHGKGKPCWWSIWVNPGREKQVVDSIERLLPRLPPIEGAEDIPRTAEIWVPAKKVRAWSIKAGKMGTKSLKYGEGGWVLVKTVLDRPFAAMMQGNVNVLGFRDREVFEGAVFPLPAPQKTLKEIKEWEEDLSDITEEQMRADIGLPAKKKPGETDWLIEEEERQEREALEYGYGRGRGRGRGGRFGDRRMDGRGRGRGDRGRGGRMSGLYTSRDDQGPIADFDFDAGQSSSGGWYSGGGGKGVEDPLNSWFDPGADSLGGLLNDDDYEVAPSEPRSAAAKSRGSFDFDDTLTPSADPLAFGGAPPSSDNVAIVDDGTWGSGIVADGGDDGFGGWLLDDLDLGATGAGDAGFGGGDYYGRGSVENSSSSGAPRGQQSGSAGRDREQRAPLRDRDAPGTSNAWDNRNQNNRQEYGGRGRDQNRFDAPIRDEGGYESGQESGVREQRSSRRVGRDRDRDRDRSDTSSDEGYGDWSSSAPIPQPPPAPGKSVDGFADAFGWGSAGDDDDVRGGNRSDDGTRERWGGDTRNRERDGRDAGRSRDTYREERSFSRERRDPGGYSNERAAPTQDDLSWWDAPSGSTEAKNASTEQNSTTTSGRAAAQGGFNAGSGDDYDFWGDSPSSVPSSPPLAEKRRDAGAVPTTKGVRQDGGSRSDRTNPSPSADVLDFWDDSSASPRDDTAKADTAAGGGGGGGGSGLAAGTAVEVVSGPFKDFDGVVLESSGGRVRAEIDVFGKPTVVEIGEGDVLPMQD